MSAAATASAGICVWAGICAPAGIKVPHDRPAGMVEPKRRFLAVTKAEKDPLSPAGAPPGPPLPSQAILR
jgi:hypothetical protein